MGKINASLASISTEFEPVEPGLYELEITKCEDVMKTDAQGTEQLVAWRVSNKITTPGDVQNKVISDYIHLRQPDDEIAADAIGLQSIKRYFEVTHGKEEVAEWSDDDFDTDLLIGKSFQAQVAIDSYTKKGETEPRKTNKFKRMEAI